MYLHQNKTDRHEMIHNHSQTTKLHNFNPESTTISNTRKSRNKKNQLNEGQQRLYTHRNRISKTPIKGTPAYLVIYSSVTTERTPL